MIKYNTIIICPKCNTKLYRVQKDTNNKGMIFLEPLHEKSQTTSRSKYVFCGICDEDLVRYNKDGNRELHTEDGWKLC